MSVFQNLQFNCRKYNHVCTNIFITEKKQKREYSLHSSEGNTYESNMKSAAEVDIERIPG